MSRMAALALVLAGGPAAALAHALDPGFLELAHLTGSEWRVTLRQPDVQGRPMRISVALEGCGPDSGPEPAHDGRAFVSSWVVTCEDGLVGGRIRIEGLENTQTDVLVRYTLLDGPETQTVRLTPETPAFEVPARQDRLALARSYAAFGSATSWRGSTT